MGATIKAEFLKLFTIRSTYIMIILSIILITVFAFYFEGYKGNTGSPASTLAPEALQEIVSNSAGLTVTFASIISILFMAHEYRYNTIMYTLTSNVRRGRVLFAKVATIILFSIGYGLLAVGLAIGCYMAGLSLRDATLPPQSFEVLEHVGKVVFYFMGYALIGLLLAMLTRSVVMAIGTLLIFPITFEPLLSIILKEDAKYLPFTALDSTVGASMMPNVLPPGDAITVTCAYLAAIMLVTWLLFVRRDAN